MRKPALKIFDYIIIAAVAAVVIVISIKIYSADPAATVLKVTSYESEYLYPLDQDLVIPVEGPIGITHIHIRDGSAFIEDSPCENKLCILMGAISRPGQWAACLPNRVFISIEGGDREQEIDILSY